MATSCASLDSEVRTVVLQARAAALVSRLLAGAQKNVCLQAYGAALLEAADGILKTARDDAAHARAHGAPAHVVHAIALSRASLEAKARLAANLAGLPDPVGRIESTWIRPNGLKIEKTRVPLGVVAVLVEYDAGAAIDAFLLCAKAGDAMVLYAGPLVYRTCRALVRAMTSATVPPQVSAGGVPLVCGPGEAVRQVLLRQCDAVDVAIPVGSQGWVDAVTRESRLPVLGQTCRRRHVYVDEEANLSMAVAVVTDTVSTDPTGDGRAVIIVHRAIAPRFLPLIAGALQQHSASFGADAEVLALLEKTSSGVPAAAGTGRSAIEVTLVDGVEAAASAIVAHGPGFSDAVVTDDRSVASRFAALVDSACVYLNASPRFTDGGQFGMGAQIAVNSGRLHARGPLGIDELTTCKYVVTGKGQVLG